MPLAREPVIESTADEDIGENAEGGHDQYGLYYRGDGEKDVEEDQDTNDRCSKSPEDTEMDSDKLHK